MVPLVSATLAAMVAPPPTQLSAALPSWVSRESATAIVEPQARDALQSLKAVDLQLPLKVATGPVRTTYLSTACKRSDLPPVVLIHGFDISCLEYRRLMPLLESAGIEAYAPCVAGWGFTDTANMKSVGVEAKRAQLLAFHEDVLAGRPALWVGAPLGACICLDAYKAKPAAFALFASLDPGFFTPPPPAVPAFVGRLLLQNVLSSLSVRESIAKQAYHIKEDQTEDGALVLRARSA